MQFADDVMNIIPARIEQFNAGHTKENNICLHNLMLVLQLSFQLMSQTPLKFNQSVQISRPH